MRLYDYSDRVHVLLDEWTPSHFRSPRGFGRWLFRDSNGDVLVRVGRYSDAVASLPFGAFTLLP